MSKPAWPKVVSRGHIKVKIYRTPSNGSDQFTVTHYLGKKRIRKSFSNFDLAFTDAETTAAKLSTGELKVLELRNEDRLAYVRAVEAIKDTGTPLEMVAIHFADAYRILGGDRLLDAARFYVKHHPSHLPKKSVPEVVAELLAIKEGDGLSDVYLEDLRLRLVRFQKAFPGRICEVTAAEIESFLRGLKSQEKKGKPSVPLSSTSRNNFRRAIGTLFYFAEARQYVPAGVMNFKSVGVAKKQHVDVEIFRPTEMGRMMEICAVTIPEIVPFVAIGAFAGLRHAEIQRLDWSEVRLDDGFIEVKASKAKTASRRLVPITDNLRAWLEPHAKADGPVSPYANMTKQLVWLAEAVDEAWKKENPPGSFKWKHNALRHSFISYRVADIQNVAQVALEAGNSPRMVFSNYRELVRPVDAKKWFGIAPKQAENVVKISEQAVA